MSCRVSLLTYNKARVIEAFETLDTLTRLVDRSLVSLDESTGRYHLLETVRQYSAEHAVNAEEFEKLRDKHFDHFLDLLQKSRGNLRGPDQLEWLARLDAEYDNIRLAMEWALAAKGRWNDALLLAVCLNNYWILRTMYLESERWIDQLAETRTDWSAAVSARLSLLASISRFFTGKIDLAKSEEAVQFARDSGQDELLGNALRNYTLDLVTLGRVAEARPLAEEALIVYGRNKDWTNAAFIHMHMGNGDLVNGRLDEAQEHFLECLALRQNRRDLRGVGAALLGLAYVADLREESEAAITWTRQGISAFVNVANAWDLAGGLPSTCIELTKAGRNVDAAKILGFADDLLAKAKGARDIADRQSYDRWSKKVKEILGDKEYKIAYQAGRHMTLDEALALLFPDGLEVPSFEDSDSDLADE
jgi:tetratricopeptide (TPR) repeat protein